MASGSSGRALVRLYNSSLFCSSFARNVSSRATAAISEDVAGSTILTKPSAGSFLQQARGLADGPSAGMKNVDEDVPSMPRLTSTGTMGRRFYKKAHTKPAEDGLGYLVLLDDRVLKTPAKKPLKVRNPALALAIAAEWEWQVRIRNFMRDLGFSGHIFCCFHGVYHILELKIPAKKP